MRVSIRSTTDMQLNAFAEQFARDGYLLIEDFFDTDLIDDLDRLIRDHFGEDPDFLHNEEFLEQSRTDVIPWFPQNEGVDTFDVIDKNQCLSQLSTAILGAGWMSQYCMVMFSKQGTSGQAWHQDCPPDDAKIFNLNRLVYTRDITAETGGEIVIVPGSHNRGLLPAGNPIGEFNGQYVLRPTKGTLVLIHGHAWHRVLPITRGCRFSINYRAAPSGTPRDVTDVCVYRNMRYRFSTSEIVENRIPGC